MEIKMYNSLYTNIIIYNTLNIVIDAYQFFSFVYSLDSVTKQITHRGIDSSSASEHINPNFKKSWLYLSCTF